MKAAIFDLDGTLIDSEMLWVESTWQYLKEQACDLGYDEVLAIVYGRSWREVYADILARVPMLGVTIEEMEVALRGKVHYLREQRGDIIIKSSVTLLRRLAAVVPVCIVSGSLRVDIEKAVALMGIGDAIQFYIGAEEYGPGKPDPTCFLMAVERLGVTAADCVVFEDSAAGVRAAKKAGMHCVALARPGFPVQDVSAADWVVTDLGDVDVSAL